MESIFTQVYNVLSKDTFSISLALVSVVFSLFSTFKLRKSNKSTDSIVKELELQIEKSRTKAVSLSESDREALFKKLNEIEVVINEFEINSSKNIVKPHNRESGFISQEFMMYAVPAIIALAFTFCLVYLLIINEKTPNYQSPEVLKSGLSTIIGYYFGMAVKEKPSGKKLSIKDLSPDEIRDQLLAALEKPLNSGRADKAGAPVTGGAVICE